MLADDQLPRCCARLHDPAIALQVAPAKAYATNADAVADSYFQFGGNFFAFCRHTKAYHSAFLPPHPASITAVRPHHHEPARLRGSTCRHDSQAHWPHPQRHACMSRKGTHAHRGRQQRQTMHTNTHANPGLTRDHTRPQARRRLRRTTARSVRAAMRTL